MKRFAQLFTELDQTTKTLTKIKALVSYFEVGSRCRQAVGYSAALAPSPAAHRKHNLAERMGL